MIAGAALAVLAIAVLWNVWRQPTYLPPPGDEINILLELAGVFPDNYKIMWREHAALRSTDPEAQSEPAILGDALFMHRLTTGSEGDVYIEAEYRFYRSRPGRCRGTALHVLVRRAGPHATSCLGRLTLGNYEFSLTRDTTAKLARNR